jgi:hypothetical protein
MKTTLLTTMMLAVFSTFTLLSLAGGQERIAAFLNHNAAADGLTQAASGPAQALPGSGAAKARPIVLLAAAGNDSRATRAGGQNVVIEGSLSGKPWWVRPSRIY